MLKPYFKSRDKDFYLLKGDMTQILPEFDFKFDMIFADPPYFLSNDGISVQSGKQVSVNKGSWDKSKGFAQDNEFNKQWLSLCRNKLSDNGTIWVSGTFHNIFSVAQAMTEMGYKILNCITWQKTNPPPNLSCRYFTHSTEFILWARKSAKSKHYFDYEMMKKINGGTQMRDVWALPAISKWEKTFGKHPTQKPLGLLARIILASTKEDAWILDPFAGSSTTGIAANILGRRFLGIDKEKEFLDLSILRRKEIANIKTQIEFRNKIICVKDEELMDILELKDNKTKYSSELPFD